MDSQTLADRLFANTAGALELYAVYLGERLGYYRALADGKPATSIELAARTGTAERYTREWLEHQAVCGLVEVDDPAAQPAERRFRLPEEHAAVLADENDIRYTAHMSIQLARYGRRLPDLVEAYRSGGAPPRMPWGPEGRGNPNRVQFLDLLGKQWLPSIPDIDGRLRAQPPARVVDLACGMGFSSIAMALAYPGITVDGLDLDEAAIEAARGNASEAGVADRVRFTAADAAELAGSQPYDLVTILEGLHDMSRPVEVLGKARKLLSDDGAVLVVDTRTEERFTAPGTLRERYEYGWSLVGCLPDAMGDPESAQTGTMMRPATLRQYAAEAGFSEVQVLPIETDYWRFYRLLTG